MAEPEKRLIWGMSLWRIGLYGVLILVFARQAFFDEQMAVRVLSILVAAFFAIVLGLRIVSWRIAQNKTDPPPPELP